MDIFPIIIICLSAFMIILGSRNYGGGVEVVYRFLLFMLGMHAPETFVVPDARCA